MKKAVTIFIGIILINTIAFGQTRTEQRIEVGDDYFKQRQYDEAIDVYERILRREDSPQIRREISFRMGEAYRRMLNYEQARQWYTKAENLGYDEPLIYLHLSEMTLGLEEFDNSIDYAKKFLEYEPDNDRGLKMLESAKYSKDHYDRETIFEVILEKRLSSVGEEWGVAYLENYPVFHDDPETFDDQFDIEIRLFNNNIIYWALRSETPKERIIFSSTKVRDEEGIVVAEHGFSNIYQTLYDRQEGDWHPPTPVKGGINSDYYDGFLSYDENNKIGYFMNCGGFRGERETCDIYWSEYDPGTDIWGKAALFSYNSDKYNIGYPSINDEGNVLYFATDNPNGYGLYDLYKIYKNDDESWGEPVNLGPDINTTYNDAYPFIAGNVLYFSSFGHPGMGGFDIFYSVIDEDGNYSTPQNMGAPVNSSADDFGFIINEDYSRGFFSSNRPGGSGNDDLYSFRVVSKIITLKGVVADRLTGKPIENLDFYIIGDDGSFYTVSTDSKGLYELPDISTDINYEIEAFHEGYEDYREEILVKDQLISSHFEVVTEYNFDLKLDPVSPIIAEEIKEPEKPAEKPTVDDEIIILDEEPAEEVIPDYVEKVEDVEVEKEKIPEPIPVTPEIKLTDHDLPTIYFDFAKYDLKPYSEKQLVSVIEFLYANPDKGMVIHAHTDEIAGHKYNFYLSQKRAHSAMNYIVRKGININRLYPLGHGKMNHVIENAHTSEEHQLNRRATFEPIHISEFQAFLNDAAKHSFRYMNSVTKDVHFAHGIEFMVQFVATGYPVHPDFYRKIINELPHINIINYYDKDRYHRYLVGSFRDFRSAYNLLWKLRELGYDTYVVAFNNGERISVSTAQSMLEDR